MTGEQLNLAQLLGLLGYTADERMQFCTKAPGGSFNAVVLGNVPVNVPQDRDVWYGVQPVRMVTSGRPAAGDVTRLAGIFADLDVKPRGCRSFKVARSIVDELSAHLGSRPVAVVYSGHGLQPLWAIEEGCIGGDISRGQARALLRRWGRLVAHVAEQNGALVDTVFDLPRILRAPGSINHKDPANPIAVLCHADTGAPVSIEQLADCLDEMNIPDHPEDHADPGAVISAPDDWTWRNTAATVPCPYASQMATGWQTDTPNDRHPWLVGQATRIAVLHRAGCLTAGERDQLAMQLLGRFRFLIGGANGRTSEPGEIADVFAWGQQRAAAMSDTQVQAELGNHQHRQPLEAPPVKEGRLATVHNLHPGMADQQMPMPGAATTLPSTPVPIRTTMQDDPTTQLGERNEPVRDLPRNMATDPLAAETGPRDSADDAATSAGPTEELTPGQMQFLADVEQQALRLHVADEARLVERARKSATVCPPDLTGLAAFLHLEDDPVQYRVDRLLPVGGRAVVAAQYKAGKSSLMGNLVRCLADGDQFLDEFDVTRPTGSVVLIDDELDERTLRRWLRDQKIRHVDNVHVVALRGKVATFDLLNETISKQWSDKLREVNCGVLVFDCLRPVLDALGLSEDKDSGQFLVAFDALLHNAGIGEALVVHHMGHGGERSRGDSRLRDWPDAEWRLVRDVAPGEEDPDAPRYFSAFGRDVSVNEGLLGWDPSCRRLTYQEGSRKEARNDAKAPISAMPDVRSYLASVSRPASGNSIEGELLASGHKRTAIRQALKAGVESGEILTERGERGAVLHYLNPSELARNSAKLASSPTSPASCGEVDLSSPDRNPLGRSGELELAKSKKTELGELIHLANRQPR